MLQQYPDITKVVLYCILVLVKTRPIPKTDTSEHLPCTEMQTAIIDTKSQNKIYFSCVEAGVVHNLYIYIVYFVYYI